MENRPHYLGHRQRLKDRLRKDPKALADYELLELLLGQVLPRRDTKPLAKELLARFGGLREALQAPMGRLAEVKGFGSALAAHWLLLSELWTRMRESKVRERQVLSGPEIVAEAAKARIGAKAVEEFWVALVDNKNRVIAWEQVSRGTVDETTVYSREILSLAIRLQAAGVVLVHNHPGGDPRPSEEDIRLTKRVVRGAGEVGLRVLDHLVVTDREHFSFHEQGLL